MANLFNNLLDRDNPAKKLQREIENTEFKKQSLIAPLQSEMHVLTQKIDGALRQIGLTVYDSYLNGEQVNEEPLKVVYDQISEHKSVLAEKEAKVKEFANRYDEEINMLKANLMSMTAPQPAVPQAFGAPGARTTNPADGPRAFCTNCGVPYIYGEDIFCTGCGSKLEG